MLNKSPVTNMSIKQQCGHVKLSGFTLIEVLIALVLIGLTLPALSLRVQTILDNSGYVNEKTVAYWLAESEFNKVKLDHHFERVKKAGSKSTSNGKGRTFKDTREKIEFASTEWFVEIKYSKVEELGSMVDRVTQVDVKVGLVENKPSVTLTGFLYE